MTEANQRNDAPEPSEPDLIRAAQQGDRHAFDALVKRYQRQVYRWAYHLVRTHDLADEIAQDVFVRTYGALARIDPERPLGAWLCKSTTNLALNLIRKRQYRAQLTDEVASRIAAENSGADRPDSELHRRQLMAKVTRAINELPAVYRTIIGLRVKEGMSYEEIAETLNISLGTVMSRLARARGRLRKALGDVLAQWDG
ncbi:MAG TPA: sigma-70 family RNA polymerase sigma factor [candidate division Zixibacteria bacterium]|jgi:RNA polymerase sigma-70 factor (ECF subfamily)